jgi:DNA-binding transcriptional LysR family regulator
MPPRTSKSLDWDSRIGRRLRLRDLHVLFAAVEHRSMSAAGVHLNMSQSAVSQAVAALEDTLKVRLLDRTTHGVKPTVYADAIMRRGTIAFDELRSGIKDIEFLADPAGGEVRIACAETLAGGILAPVIETFSRRYPKVVFEILQSNTFIARDFVGLRARKVDLELAMLSGPPDDGLHEDLNVEHLFDEMLCPAASPRSRWARRQKLRLADVADACWITPFSGATSEKALFEAFRAQRLPPPHVIVKTVSAQLRNFLSLRGSFVALVPSSLLQINAAAGLKRLPLRLPMPRIPVVMITLRNRTLSRTVELFLDCVRDVAKTIALPREQRTRR